MSAEARKWHLGVLSFTGTGHLLPLLALGQELKLRGHKVTFFERPKIEERVRNAGMDFVAVGDRRSQKRENDPIAVFGLAEQLRVLQFNVNRMVGDVERFLENTPAAITNAGVNALIVNEIALTGPTIAQMLELPYFLVSTSIPHRFGWGEYRRFGGYRLSESLLSRLERGMLELSCLRLRGPVGRAIDRRRRIFGLGPMRRMQAEHPCLAHIVQVPQFFDLQRKRMPRNVLYAGPFSGRSTRPEVEFPWNKLDGRPLIYASLGTARNVPAGMFRLVAEGCAGLGVQLVISLGNRFDPSELSELPGAPIVTRYAPQPELIRKATAVITHAGLNTILETLAEGKPMVAIPLAYDQPANALRLERLGLAVVLPVMRLTADRIKAAVATVMFEPRYREAAHFAKSELGRLNGAECAASIIENSLEACAAARLNRSYDVSDSNSVIPESRSEYCRS